MVRVFFLTLILLIVYSCKSDYEKYIDAELAKNKRYDDLMFQLKIGQTQSEFFSICWDLNKKGLVTNGSGANVLYIEPIDSLNPQKRRKEINYYGIFDDNKVMQGMRMTYSYLAWSPGNQAFSADSLLEDVKTELMDYFKGNNFMQIDLDKVKAYVKIDGNRHILAYISDPRFVTVKIEDLNFKYKKK